MISWTITAEPVAATASSASTEFTSADDVTDQIDEIYVTATASSETNKTASTDASKNYYSTTFARAQGESAYSFYDSDGNLGSLEDSGSESQTTSIRITHAWSGGRTTISEYDGLTTTYFNTTSTTETTRDTSRTTAVTAMIEATTTASASIISGTTTETESATVASTASSLTTLTTTFATTSTFSAKTVTTTTFSEVFFGYGGSTWMADYGIATAYDVRDEILFSVANPTPGHWSNNAQSFTGAATITSNFATRQGAVVTITAETFTNTAITSSGTVETSFSTTTQLSLLESIHIGFDRLPLSQTTIGILYRTTTQQTSAKTTFVTSDADDLPTQSQIAQATKLFTASLDHVFVTTAGTGTSQQSAYASYWTVGSSSETVSSGPSDFNGALITNRTTTSSTNQAQWQETLSNGFNFILAGSQSAAAKYFVGAWAAASNITAARQISAAIDSVILPTTIKGNQTIQLFVGSTQYTNGNSSITASVDGAAVSATYFTGGTSRTTTSASIAAVGNGVTRNQSLQSNIAPGGKAASGNVSVVRFPGAFFTSGQSASGTTFIDGENLQVGATSPKTAMLPMPYAVGNRGPLKVFVTQRNENNI